MSTDQSVDFYEILEISPNANVDTIDRVFRYLAQRYHPDHTETGDPEKFTQIVKAHNTLRDPEKRADYDIHYKRASEYQWGLVEEAGQWDGFENDEIIQARVLSVLYVKRKRSIHNPGSGNLEIERLTGCPNEILDFHLWYLREKGWIYPALFLYCTLYIYETKQNITSSNHLIIYSLNFWFFYHECSRKHGY